MRYSPLIRRGVPVALSLSLLAGAAAGCVSDRSTPGETLTGTTCSAPSSAAGSTVVFIRNFVFDPAEVHVRPGGGVVWVNCEPTNIPHTSTSNTAAWESGSLAPGAAFVHSFTASGSSSYHCALHPGMRGTVVVD